MITKNFTFTIRFLTLFAILVGAGFVNSTFAQGSVASQVGKIRKLYADTNAQIAAGLKDKISGLHHAGVTVGGERDGQQWGGVGNMSDRTDFYFSCEPFNIEECDGITDARNLIVKISTEYRAAGDLHTNAEYLFNEQGELVFVYTKDAQADGKMLERRFYFEKEKLIRVVRDGKNIDRAFTEDDKTQAQDALEEVHLKKNLFVAMFAGEQ